MKATGCARRSLLRHADTRVIAASNVDLHLAVEQKKFRESLKKGDSVLTSGGILGTIEGLTEQVVTLQIASGVKIKVLRTAVAGGVSEELEKK